MSVTLTRLETHKLWTFSDGEEHSRFAIGKTVGNRLESYGLIETVGKCYVLTPFGREVVVDVEFQPGDEYTLKRGVDVPEPTQETVKFLDEIPPARMGPGAAYPEPRFLRERPGKWAAIMSGQQKRINSVYTCHRRRFSLSKYEFAVRTVDGVSTLYGRFTG